jgi:hypothetical protein
LKDTAQPEYLLQSKSDHLRHLESELSTLESLSPMASEYTQENLRGTLMFIDVLKEELGRLRSQLEEEGLP